MKILCERPIKKGLEMIIFMILLLPIMTNAQIHEFNENEMLIPFPDTENKWGYLDAKSGMVKISPKYDRVELFIDGFAYVYNADPKANIGEMNSLVGMIDTSGREVFSPKFTGKYEVKNRKGYVFPNLIEFTDDKERAGVARIDGTWLIPMGTYDEIEFYTDTQFVMDDRVLFDNGTKYKVPRKYKISRIYFEEHLFEIQKKEFFTGVVSWAGKTVVPPNYIEIAYVPQLKRFVASRLKTKFNIAGLNQSKAMLLFEKLTGGNENDPIIIDLLDEQGKILASFPSRYVANIINEDDEIASYEYLDQTHYFSLITGEPFGSPLEKSAYNYNIFSKKNLQGLKNKEGNELLPAKFLRLKVVSDSLIIAQNPENYNYAILEPHGEQRTPFEYHFLTYINNNQFSAQKEGKYGVIDADGTVIIDFKYTLDVSFDEEGLAHVYQDGNEGVIDRTGNEIIPIIYETLFNSRKLGTTKSTYFRVEKDDKWGLLDHIGEIVIPFDYGFIHINEKDFDLGWVRIEDVTRNYNGLYNIKTKIIIPPVNRFVKVYPDFLIVGKKIEGKDSYQLLTSEGKPLTDDSYTQMDLKYGYLSCQKDKLYGVLDITGNVIVPFIYNYLWERSPHLLLAQKGNHYFYIDTQGTEFKMPE